MCVWIQNSWNYSPYTTIMHIKYDPRFIVQLGKIPYSETVSEPRNRSIVMYILIYVRAGLAQVIELNLNFHLIIIYYWVVDAVFVWTYCLRQGIYLKNVLKMRRGGLTFLALLFLFFNDLDLRCFFFHRLFRSFCQRVEPFHGGNSK